MRYEGEHLRRGLAIVGSGNPIESEQALHLGNQPFAEVVGNLNERSVTILDGYDLAGLFVDDRHDMQRDRREQQVEHQFVRFGGEAPGVEFDQIGERARFHAVDIDREQTQPDLEC